MTQDAWVYRTLECGCKYEEVAGEWSYLCSADHQMNPPPVPQDKPRPIVIKPYRRPA